MSDFEARRLERILQQKIAVERDRRVYAEEVMVKFPVGPCGCSSCYSGCCCSCSVGGMLMDRGTALAVIVCHPWGPLGGSMFDPNVQTLCNLLGGDGAGLTTLRFNFRTGLGTGASSVADVRTACSFLLSRVGRRPQRILLVGYSYGASVVASAAPSIPAVCQVGIPMSLLWDLCDGIATG